MSAAIRVCVCVCVCVGKNSPCLLAVCVCVFLIQDFVHVYICEYVFMFQSVCTLSLCVYTGRHVRDKSLPNTCGLRREASKERKGKTKKGKEKN